MANAPTYELMAAQDLPDISGDGSVPDWIHLLPAGRIETFDGRGPYEIEDAQAVINASFAQRGDIEIDVNHSSFIAAPRGEEAPARGWVVEMQAREDGIWGRVEWTEDGRQLVASRAYRRISPVLGLASNGSGKVISIKNASLVNRQNLCGLTALNQEQGPDMDFMAKLAEALGLSEGGGEGAILEAIKALKGGGDKSEAHAEIAEIGVALGCADGADATTVLNAARELAKGGTSAEVVALQSELAQVTTRLNDLTEGNKRDAAVAFVDGAIRARRVGVKASRDRFIELHMESPEKTEAMIAAMPKLDASQTNIEPPAAQEGEIALNAEQVQVAAMLGQDPKAFAATLEAEKKEARV